MEHKDTKRLSRLTAILIQLQAKRMVTANDLARKFGVSARTIYRDIKALEQAGVPIVTEEGKGFSLLEGYRLPPVMFTESEANALITAEQLVFTNKDASFIREYTEAISKIKAVLKYNTKDKADLLANRIVFRHNLNHDRTSNYLATLQLALTNYMLTHIEYNSLEKEEVSTRTIEPFALYSTQENWLLIAWCRLRKDFRTFRLDRIKQLQVLEEKFEPHTISIQEYFKICLEKSLYP